MLAHLQYSWYPLSKTLDLKHSWNIRLGQIWKAGSGEQAHFSKVALPRNEVFQTWNPKTPMIELDFEIEKLIQEITDLGEKIYETSYVWN